MNFLKLFRYFSICLILLVLFQPKQLAITQQLIDRSIIHQPQTHDLQPILIQPTEFKVLNSQNEIQIINTSIQSFRLSNNQTYASFATDQVFINISEIPTDALILPEAGFSKSTDDKTILHQIYLEETSPFMFDPETNLFHGKIAIHPIEGNLQDQAETARSQIDLIDPFEIIVSAIGITDKTIVVKSLNWPPIMVEFDFDVSEKPLKDSVNVVVITVQNPEGYATPVRISPYIEISVEKDRIQGLGIQETPVSLSLQGVSHYPDVIVSLQTTKGYFDPVEITLRANHTSTVSLRSEGTGEARISVEAANLISTSDHISFMFPWKFLLFSIIGAVIGASIHVLRKLKTGFDTRAFVVGVLLGFTVSLCYWALGVNLLSITIEVSYLNEFAVIALSILGALLGWHLGRMKETT